MSSAHSYIFSVGIPQSSIITAACPLSMADPRARKWLMDQIEAHFFGEGVAHPEGYVAPETKAE